MKRKTKNYDIEIEDIFCNRLDRDGEHIEVIGIDWSSNVGFGRWEGFVGEDHKLHVDTEHMDIQDDKEFTKQLFAKLVDEMIIEG